ncbi:hypothetical protein HI914_00813 [Erysiphe necator]|nr:hypothetical protein HI914_00813 [Erysiphe necator]
MKNKTTLSNSTRDHISKIMMGITKKSLTITLTICKNCGERFSSNKKFHIHHKNFPVTKGISKESQEKSLIL